MAKKKAPAKATKSTRAGASKKAAAGKAPRKTRPASKNTAPAPRANPAAAKAAPSQPKPEKRSFWSFLGVGSKKKEKVNLMEVRRK